MENIFSFCLDPINDSVGVTVSCLQDIDLNIGESLRADQILRS